MVKDVIGKYLGRYAEAEIKSRPALDRIYEHVVVIPAFDEPADFLDTVLAGIPDGVAANVLVIVVVNVPDHILEDDPRVMRTRTLLHSCAGAGRVIVDRVTHPVPRRQGVGLARKLGADMALAYIQDGSVAQPVIFSTDADAVLPAGYFQAVEDHTDAGAPANAAPATAANVWLLPYAHTSADPDLQRRADCYELHMRWYVEGLRRARSPYAFHSLGSTIVVSARAYANVRGFPKRDAAEDFYLLDKLAKVTTVQVLPAPCLSLAARLSTRVPFGTGPALEAVPDIDASFTSYATEVFDCLAAAIDLVDTNDETACDQTVVSTMADLGYFDRCRGLDRVQRHQWFDGLKTLRFVHAAQKVHPDRPLLVTLQREFPAGSGTIAALLEVFRALQRDMQKRALFGVLAPR